MSKKNETPMQTAHTDIISTLVGLYKPSISSSEVPFAPVRECMVDMYEAAIDPPDVFKTFGVVIGAGGHDSRRTNYLHQSFTKIHVGPNVRKMLWEAYGVVEYRVAFPRMRYACIR